MPRGVSILALEPRWLPTEDRHRYGVGFSMRCPTHRGECRLSFIFANPADGDDALPGGPYYWRVGGALEDLTVLDFAQAIDQLSEITVLGTVGRLHDPIEVRGHWRGRIIGGRVFTERADQDEEDVVTDPLIPLLKAGEDA